MRKRTIIRLCLLLSLVFIIPSMMRAGVVTEQDALLKAKQFMPGKKFQQQEKASHAPMRGGQADIPAYYVFNADEDDGFVIVSADDRTEAILGYADNGSFDTMDMPSNVKAWLEFYEQSIRSLNDGQTMAAPERPSRDAIAPLIKTKWSQDNPYNLQCPMDGSSLSVTGCVATALAQVMFYHKWPVATDMIPSYTTDTKQTYLESLPATTFKWEFMKEEYDSNDSENSVKAIAELMRYCGQINMMDYTNKESRAYLLIDNIISLFDYSKNMYYAERSNYTNKQWENNIYEELANKRPVIYDGGSRESRHQFICDGYDGNGLFHINWGWGGNYDGYFILSLANPSGKGIGGGIGSDGYSNNQNALFEFKPAIPNEETHLNQIKSSDVSFNKSDYSRSSIDQNFEEGSLYGSIFIKCNQIPENTQTIEAGWAIFKDGVFIKILDYKAKTINAFEYYNGDVADGYSFYYSYITNNISIPMGANLEEGKYQLCQVYRFMNDDNEWSLCDNHTNQSLIAEVHDTSMNIRKIDSNTVFFTVDKINYSENSCVGIPIDVSVSITNTGETTRQNIYFWTRLQDSEEWDLKATALASLDPGETGIVVIQFTPSSIEQGLLDVKITSDAIGNEIRGSGSINISATEQITTDGVVCLCILNTSNAFVIKPTSECGETLIVPSTVTSNGLIYNVISINENAFKCCLGLKKITISEGIQSVGRGAFKFCEGLERIDLPSTLKSIDDFAFDGCNLSLITIRNDSPFILGNTVFNNPSSITLNVPTGTKETYQATAGWNRFTNILEGEIKEATIDGFTYEYFTGSRVATLVKGQSTSSELIIPASIVIDDIEYSITSIGENAFERCVISVLTISEGIKTIKKGAFYQSTLRSVHLPSTLTTIGGYAFGGCYNMEELIIPEGTLEIETGAFHSCHNIRKIELPSTLLTIGNYAFYECPKIMSITVKMEKPFIISNSVFGLRKENDYGGYSIEPSQATLYTPSGTSQQYQLTEGWNLLSSFLEGELKEATIDDVTYFVTGPQTVTVVGSTSNISNLVIPGSITIDEIKYSVTNIGASSFEGNSSIKTVTILEGVNKIGNSAFRNCQYITKFDIPSTLTSIDDYAFYGCNALYSITSRIDNPFEIGNNVFSAISSNTILCTPIGSSNLYKQVPGWNLFTTIVEGEIKEITIDEISYACFTGSREATLVSGKPSLSCLIIPPSISINNETYIVTTIGDYALRSKSFTSLKISEGITTIGSSAFMDCNNLQLIDLPSTLTSIGDMAFYGCDNLLSVTLRGSEPIDINNNVFYLRSYNDEPKLYPPHASLHVPVGTQNTFQSTSGWNQFLTITEGEVVESTIDGIIYYCDTGTKTAHLAKIVSLPSEEFYLPDTISLDGNCFQLTTIGKSVFYWNYSIKKIVIPEGVISIGRNSFQACVNLESIVLPSTLTFIDEYAFCNCYNLQIINARMDEPFSISENVFNGIPNTSVLCVTKGTAYKYRETDGWSSFATVAEPVVVTARDYTIQYGDDLPVLGYTSEGEQLNGSPQIICAATNESPVGTYPIAISKGTVTNYNDTYIDGILTITKAPLTITANDCYIWQDDTLPVLNVTYQGFKNGEDSTALAKLPVVIPEVTGTNVIGEYDICVSGAESQNYDITYIPGKLTVKERIPGDVTGSGAVDIQDATIVVNYILGNRSDNYVYYMADLNKDDEIDVFDVTAIINVILGRTSFHAPIRMGSSGYKAYSYPSSNRSSYSVREEYVYLQTISDKMGLSIANASRFTSFQMDVEVPDGAELQNVELTGSRSTHFVQKAKIGDNLYRVIVLSMSSQPLADGNDELVSFQITSTANAEISVSNVMFVTPKGDAHYFNGASTMTPTIMNEIKTDKDEVIFDLSGKRIYKKPKELERGVYIINNEKVIIK